MSFIYRIELKDGSWHTYESPESNPEPSDEYWEFFDNHRDEVADLFSVHLTGLPTDKEKKNSLAQNNGSNMCYKDMDEIDSVKLDYMPCIFKFMSQYEGKFVKENEVISNDCGSKNT